MSQLLLINPSPRPSKRGKAKRKPTMRKHRTAAQKAATRRLVALNRSRRASPAKRRVTKRRTVHHVMTANPSPRRRRRVTHRAAHAVHHSRRRRSYRRNPISAGGVKGMLTVAVKGALGATAVNTLWNYLGSYLPISLTTGNMSYLSKAVVAIGLGSMGGKIVSRPLAHQMAIGSLTVTMHDAIKDNMGAMMPGMNLGFISPAMAFPPGNVPSLTNMGMYQKPIGMGEYSAHAPTLNGAMNMERVSKTKGMSF